MSTEETHKPSAYETAMPSRDVFGLGRTSGQRGAEILAGFRAEHIPSPEHNALARWSGRVVARMVMSFLRDNSALNYTLARPIIIDHLLRESVPKDESNIVIVEIAAGLSPRGLRLAREMPHATVIEVDLPDVIAEKQRRIKRGRDLEIPPNLEWLAGDLATTPLTELMGDRRAHAISAEGLVGYLRHPHIITLSKSLRECLHPGGVFITDLGLREGVQQIEEVARFFSRQAGSWYGTADDIDQAQQLMYDSGFSKVEAYLPNDLTDKIDLPEPILDISCFLRSVR